MHPADVREAQDGSGRASLEALGAVLLSAGLYAVLAWSERGLSTHTHRRLSMLAYGAALTGLFGIYAWVVATAPRWRATFPAVVRLAAPALFAIAWWLNPPVLSIDVYSYLADGYLWRQGLNPYLHGVRELRGTPEGVALAAYGWRPVHGISPYGPLWMLIEVNVARAAGTIPQAVLLFKGIAVVAGVLITAAINAARQDVSRVTRLRAVVLFAWNPAIVTEFAGEGHNDLVMILAVMVGLWWLVRGRILAGALAMAVGVLAKYLPLLFALPTLAYAWRTRSSSSQFWRTAGACVALSAAVAMLLYAPFWAGRATLGGVRSASHTGLGPGTSGVLFWALSHASIGHASAVAGGMSAVLVVAFVIVASLQVRDAETLIAACATIALAYILIGTPRFWPWYVALPTALLALTPTRRAVLLVVVLTFCAKLVAPLDVLRVAGTISWTTESLVMTVVGAWIPLLVWLLTGCVTTRD